MIVLVLTLVAVCVLFPLYSAWRIWRLDELTRADWLMAASEPLVWSLVVMLVGRWDIAGYWTRIALVTVVVLALGRSMYKHRRRPWLRSDPLWRPADASLWRTRWTSLVSWAVAMIALTYVALGFRVGGDTRALGFPLDGGWFMVAQGGGNTLLNHHANHRAQAYAADIVGLNAAGFHASGLQPRDPREYAIFGARVISPCSGLVITSTDGLPDLDPPKRDWEHPAGNSVAIACNDIIVELAHLQRGSVAVAARQTIEAGDVVGRVGNSGNTTEPHLHIHATDAATGIGVPISLAGVFPVRNTTFRR